MKKALEIIMLKVHTYDGWVLPYLKSMLTRSYVKNWLRVRVNILNRFCSASGNDLRKAVRALK